MSITEQEKHRVKKFVKELSTYKGRHTELVSVYIPQDYDINKIIQHLAQEGGTATNIKDASTRKNVIDALEKMIQHLRLFKRTPPNGLAAFSGNIAAAEGKKEFKVWSIEPPIPLKTRLYRCDKTFVIDLLLEMLDVKEVYGLIVMDRRDANIAYLKGKTIIPLQKTHSEVPGKIKAGGQCLTKDTIVQLSDGSLPQIESVHNPHTVKSVNIFGDLSIQDSSITDKWKTRKNKVYRIVTKHPRLEVLCSKDHTFFIMTNRGIVEKPAGELRIGDLLIMPEKIDIKGKVQRLSPLKYYNSFAISKEGQKMLIKKREAKRLLQKELAKRINVEQTTISYYEIGRLNANREPLARLCNELGIDFEQFICNYTTPVYHQDSKVRLPKSLDRELAQFLGYLTGDGSIETDRISFFEQSKQVAAAYKDKFDAYFCLLSSYRFRQDKNYHQLRFCSRPLARLISNEFSEVKSKKGVEIPHKVLLSDNKILAAYLKGLFDAEGYVHRNRGVALGINNKRLAQSIQMAFLRLGILSSLHEYDNRKNPYSKNPRFTVDIVEKQSLETFGKDIGFTSIEKTQKLARCLLGRKEKNCIRQIIIPGRDVRQIIEHFGHNLALFPKVSNFFRNGRMMSKKVFQRSVLNNINDKKLKQRLKKILECPVLPVKIMKIEVENKTADMIDISVRNQNFIANGIIAHNSANRFAQNTELAAKAHYKKVAEYVKDQFLSNTNLKGILVGGPGPTKYTFVEGEFITNELRKKIIAIKDLGYTGEFGLQELVDKSEDVLAAEAIMEEKKLVTRFLEMLAKEPGKAAYGEADVMKNIKNGAADIVLLSEDLDDEKIEEFEKEAGAMGTKVNLISTETREGVQLRDLGKVGAILRYAVA